MVIKKELRDMKIPDLIGFSEDLTRGYFHVCRWYFIRITQSFNSLTRINSHSPLVESIICTRKTRLTHIGRDLSGKLGIQERSCIRRVDRCLANSWYQNHSSAIYTALSQWLLEHYPNPVIAIDWSSAPNTSQRFEQGGFCILRATLTSIGPRNYLI